MDAMSWISMIPEIKLEKDEGDYEKDGLIHCGKCDTPRQVRIGELLEVDADIVKTCLCKCRTKKLEDEKHEIENAKIREKTKGYIRDNYKQIQEFVPDETFENDKGYQPKIKIAKDYCKNWNENLKNNVGIIFVGSPSSGKSFMASCIANELSQRGIPVIKTRIKTLIDDMFDRNKTRYIKNMSKAELLVIDDFGTEHSSSYNWSQVYDIIDTRYRAKKPIIVTTNLSAKQLKENNGKDIEFARIAERLIEMCIIVDCTLKKRDGSVDSIRRLKHKELNKEAKEIFMMENKNEQKSGEDDRNENKTSEQIHFGD